MVRWSKFLSHAPLIQIDFEPYTLTALDECDGEVPV